MSNLTYHKEQLPQGHKWF